jgi:hypothetical protein
LRRHIAAPHGLNQNDYFRKPQHLKYQEVRFPTLQKAGQNEKLVGYFESDTGTLNQLGHLWKFDDDADRPAPWRLYSLARISSMVSF